MFDILLKKNTLVFLVYMKKKRKKILIMSIKAQGGRGLKVLRDMSAKNISFLFKIPRASCETLYLYSKGIRP